MKYALIEDYVKAEKSIVKLRRTIKEAKSRFYDQTLMYINSYEEYSGGFNVERDVIDFVDVEAKLKRRLTAREKQAERFKTFVAALPAEQRTYLLDRYVGTESVEYNGRLDRNIHRKLKKLDKEWRIADRRESMGLDSRMDKLEKHLKPSVEIPIIAWQDDGNMFIVDGKPISDLQLKELEEAGQSVIKATWAE